MRTGVLTALIIGAGLWFGALAHAQQPAPPAPAPAPSPPPEYGPPITNEQAKAAAAAAFAEAKKNNWRMAFTIVGPAGELVYFEKMDGTQHASIDISPRQGAHGRVLSPSEQGVRRSICRRQHRVHDLPGSSRSRPRAAF